MIQNAGASDLEARLDVGEAHVSLANLFVDAVRSHPEPFDLYLKGNGLEFAAVKPVEGRPNRAIVKFFIISGGPNSGRAALFFYKRSQIPFSHDRLSYGVCMVPGPGQVEAEANEWLYFASSGFDPNARPSRLRQAFAFSIPE